MWTLLAAVVTALVSAGVAVYQNHQQKKLNEHLTGSQEEQNQFNAIQAGIQRDFTAEEAQKSRDFTEYMARNKYSMETQSMQDAGVNPAMVYGGGSLVPTAANGATGAGAQASAAGSGNAGLPTLAGMIEPLMAAVRMPLEMKQMQANLEQTRAATERTQAETEGIRITNYITESTKDAIIRATNMEPDKKQAEIDNIISQTKNEDVRNQILGVELIQKKLDYDQSVRMNELVFDMQRMQNDYQKFVNDHQEKQWNIEYNKICAEINDLYASAKKKMSDIEVNNAQKGLLSAQEGYTRQQTKTEEVRTKHEAVNTWKDYYDPKAHLTRSVVDPMNWLHDINKEGNSKVLNGLKDFWQDTKDQYRKGMDTGPYGKHSGESHDEYLREMAEDIMTMWSTYGQAFEEYSPVQ